MKKFNKVKISFVQILFCLLFLITFLALTTDCLSETKGKQEKRFLFEILKGILKDYMNRIMKRQRCVQKPQNWKWHLHTNKWLIKFQQDSTLKSIVEDFVIFPTLRYTYLIYLVLNFIPKTNSICHDFPQRIIWSNRFGGTYDK